MGLRALPSKPTGGGGPISCFLGGSGWLGWRGVSRGIFLVESGPAANEPNHPNCVKAPEWSGQAQIQGSTTHYGNGCRRQSKGVWAFSTPTQGYNVSDCTAEALMAVVYLQDHLQCVLPTDHAHRARLTSSLASP